MNKKKPWTKEEVNFLKENSYKMSLDDLSKNLNRTVSAIENKIYYYNLPKLRVSEDSWTEEELSILTNPSLRYTRKIDLLESKDLFQIRQKACDLGIDFKYLLPKTFVRYNRSWSQEEETALIKYSHYYLVSDLEKIFNRTDKSIMMKLYAHGVRVSRFNDTYCPRL